MTTSSDQPPDRSWIAAFASKAGLTPEETRELRGLVSGDVKGRGSATLPIGHASTLTPSDLDDPPPVATRPSLDLPRDPHERYDDLGPIARGGMGEVRRVRDRSLNRVMAMKVVRAERALEPMAAARFIEEAQATAQLQHPGIVPVHDVGQLPDGRLFFTMQEIRGRTMASVLAALHEATRDDPHARTASGWSFRRVIDAIARVAEAVAYAHGKGVVHRDIKPDNIMLGEFGEVLLVDWGLAAVRGAGAEAVQTTRSEDDAFATRRGTIAGTPAYMAPEQARGQTDAIGPHTDVYAIGATMFYALCGRAPFQGDVEWVVLAVQTTAPTFAQRLGDDAIAAICRRAMARRPEARHASAADLADALRGWLEGAQRRDRARAVVDRGTALAPEAERLAADADDRRARAEARRAELESWRPLEDLADIWALEDEAAELAHQAAILDLQGETTLHAALTVDPDLADAHAALAELYRTKHARAEADADDAEQLRAEVLLRTHTDALPDRHPDKPRHTAYLAGDGALTLVTDPPAEAILYRYEEQDRRLVPVRQRSLGTTPLHAVTLPMGSYLIRMERDGYEPVSYPVLIERLGHWDGVPPGGTGPVPIALPAQGSLEPDDCYVPAGWFIAGAADPTSTSDPLPRRRVWLDGLVFKRNPVTAGEYLAFLDDLAQEAGVDAALALAPALSPTSTDPAVEWTDGFRLVPDAEGDVWQEHWPIVLVDLEGARAYASRRKAHPHARWRLPHELEWEKAARGVDGRRYPWGHRFEYPLTNLRGSRPTSAPVEVQAATGDVSPYGLRWMAGNALAFCANRYVVGGPPIAQNGRPDLNPDPPGARAGCALRGGGWSSGRTGALIAARLVQFVNGRGSNLGFRICRDV